eukprot:TRINITY_DN10520_c0_g1_i1.p1 TRINITY_DN10520_c0_g1~~TRINITY_DN10520_c0_g1_i1.p1  ORF type:complete len:136 (+),score=29.98 TRINITY_DN10520_c0_g1_i1:19-426(+)
MIKRIRIAFCIILLNALRGVECAESVRILGMGPALFGLLVAAVASITIAYFTHKIKPQKTIVVVSVLVVLYVAALVFLVAAPRKKDQDQDTPSVGVDSTFVARVGVGVLSIGAALVAIVCFMQDINTERFVSPEF